MIRRAGAVLAAGVLGWAVLAGTAAGAQTDPVFEPAAAQDLADLLAEATEVQNVCYGWTVRISDLGAGPDGQSTGSNFGPGQSLDSAGNSCRSRVEFTANIVYTSSYSESNDSASWAVTSRPRGGPGTDDLDRLELFDEGDLVGEDPGLAVARAVAALPQLAASAGIAPPLTADPAASAPPDVGSLADSPGSDFLRRSGGLLAFGAVLLVGGVAFGAFALRNSRARREPTRPRHAPPPDPSPTPDTPPKEPPPKEPPPEHRPPPQQ